MISALKNILDLVCLLPLNLGCVTISLTQQYLTECQPFASSKLSTMDTIHYTKNFYDNLFFKTML